MVENMFVVNHYLTLVVTLRLARKEKVSVTLHLSAPMDNSRRETIRISLSCRPLGQNVKRGYWGNCKLSLSQTRNKSCRCCAEGLSFRENVILEKGPRTNLDVKEIGLGNFFRHWS